MGLRLRILDLLLEFLASCTSLEPRRNSCFWTPLLLISGAGGAGGGAGPGEAASLSSGSWAASIGATPHSPSKSELSTDSGTPDEELELLFESLPLSEEESSPESLSSISLDGPSESLSSLPESLSSLQVGETVFWDRCVATIAITMFCLFI